MQRKVGLWITGAFQTTPSLGIEAITVVVTTRHSRTNDLTTSKALQWAIK